MHTTVIQGLLKEKVSLLFLPKSGRGRDCPSAPSDPTAQLLDNECMHSAISLVL